MRYETIDTLVYGIALYAIGIVSWQLLLLSRGNISKLLMIQIGIIGVSALCAALRLDAYRDTRTALQTGLIWIAVFVLLDSVFVAPGLGFVALLFPTSVFKYGSLAVALLFARIYAALLNRSALPAATA